MQYKLNKPYFNFMPYLEKLFKSTTPPKLINKKEENRNE